MDRGGEGRRRGTLANSRDLLKSKFKEGLPRRSTFCGGDLAPRESVLPGGVNTLGGPLETFLEPLGPLFVHGEGPTAHPVMAATPGRALVAAAGRCLRVRPEWSSDTHPATRRRDPKAETA
jgi:hypothetical protein